MGLFGLFKKKSDETKVGNVEDFISLTRVYFQSVIATNLGITNIRFLPDVANFKRLFKIPTQGGKLGLAEKSASRKMLMQDYGLNESFFKEIDSSVKRNCRTQNDIQSYLFMYQGFSNDLMMLMGNLMQWKFRMPSIFKKALYGMTQKTVHDVCTKTVWKADDVHKTAATVRQYKERLGYSEQWMTDYVYNILPLFLLSLCTFSFALMQKKKYQKEKIKAAPARLLRSYFRLKGRNSLRSNSLPFLTP